MADAEMTGRGDVANATVVVAAALALVVGPVGGALAAGGGQSPPLADGTQLDADDVLLRVDLRPDGSAAWTVEHRVRLDDENTTEAFESVKADVESNPENFTERFAARMERTAAIAANATGRGMRIENVTVSATRKQLPQEYGVITYRFVWTGFAAVNGSRVRAGDALAGLFLDEETTLLFSWPSGYRVLDVSPSPSERRERAVVWSGPLDFAEGEPLLVLTSAPATTDGGGPGGGDGGDGRGGGIGVSTPLFVTVVVIVAVLGGGWLVLGRHGGAAGGTATGTTTGGDGGGPEGPPEELLSNEERVLRLLEEHGGRVKQQTVVERLGWTEAKTSQVVGELRERGEIEAFRLGRENVLSLPDEN